MKPQRRHDEAHQVDIVDRIRLFGRHVGAVAVRPHQCQHDEMRLEREAVLGLEGLANAGVDAHSDRVIDIVAP